ncbi:MAG: META domain-containing protein [Anaerolineales bacterium]
MKTKSIALFLFAALFLAACAAPGSGSLAGTSWILQSINGIPVGGPVDNQNVTLIFTSATEMGGFGGCNSYGGSYQAGVSSIAFSDIMSTLMACVDNNISRVETEFFNALNEANAYSLTQCESCVVAGTLTITGGGQTLVFVVQ